jgi:predicted nuclease of predicted toxin-antitoxin system
MPAGGPGSSKVRENPKLVTRLADLYPGSSHVSSVGLDRASDVAVWEFARDHDYVIVTKDVDYNNMAVIRGFPPKVLWLLIGNCTTVQVEILIRSHHPNIEAFEQDPILGTLCLR